MQYFALKECFWAEPIAFDCKKNFVFFRKKRNNGYIYFS